MRRVPILAGGWLLVSLFALTAVWHFVPPTTPPLYDALCIADPYHYLVPPAGFNGNVAPHTAQKDLALDNGVQPTTEMVTDESNPQAQMIATQGTFVVPVTASSISLSIQAVPPPGVQPSNGVIDGNVYRFGASVKGVESTLTTNATVLLRTTKAAGDASPVLEHFVNGTWVPLATTSIGCANTYGATSPSLGDFAMVFPSSGAQPGSGSGSGGQGSSVWLVGGAVLLALGTAAAFAFRQRR